MIDAGTPLRTNAALRLPAQLHDQCEESALQGDDDSRAGTRDP